ncbi:ABC transporter ATP-binding protein [Acanthopleuribacter pedis]|uniref:ABC transporter ATP-binding protein n=1 Tax=Acanthopleuribacter pedis TaxID=442870 RepID=A0A8J7U3C0_9BACT|nr:ABC transporter ATP-binding protein [Acanthopleuribacter pedis]MBO1319472.1 ABC transporter ATP-binding protein [Acanthopleuribacter pedis]
MEALLTAVNVKKTYLEGTRRVPVIGGLDFNLYPGEYVVVMGSSGSGKSSLLYLLGGMDTPCAGSIQIGGGKLEAMDETKRALMRRERIGFVFQDFNLVPHLSLLENILVAGYLGTTSRRAVRERARELMALVGIEHLADRRPAQTSGGEQQRCAVARALINDPDIVLADEPTGNLNGANSRTMLDLFDTIHGRGQTLVMVTHEPAAACRAQRVAYMADGSIEEFAFPDHVASEGREALLLNWLSERGW